MVLRDVLKDIKYEVVSGNLDVSINEIAYDSRCVTDGVMFVALTGFMVDGHDYIDKAIDNGASVIMVEKDIDISNKDVTVVKVDNTRRALATVSRAFYGYPDKELTTIGITGTKGKTTTSWTIMKILEESGNKCGCIGTMGVFIGDKYYHTKNTSPEAYDVYKKLQYALNKLGLDDAGYQTSVLKAMAVINIIADTEDLIADKDTLVSVIDGNQEKVNKAVEELENLKAMISKAEEAVKGKEE